MTLLPACTRPPRWAPRQARSAARGAGRPAVWCCVALLVTGVGLAAMLTTSPLIAGASGGDVCVAVRGRNVQGDPTQCDSDGTSVAVAVHLSQAQAYDGSRAVSVDGSLALAIADSTAIAAHGSAASAVVGSQATAVNDGGAGADHGSRARAVNGSSASASDNGSATAIDGSIATATDCHARAVHTTATC
ncbi:MAG: hypothetical protein ACKOA9_08355 [Actinomycetota bacterium]